MKKLLAVFLSLFVVSSVAFAKPSVESDFATMSKADSQFLFQEGAKVASLDQAEMKKTEGEWVSFAVGGLMGAGNYLYHTYYKRDTRFSWRGLGTATAFGVVGGTFSRVAKMAGYGLTSRSFGNIYIRSHSSLVNHLGRLFW